MSIGTPRVSTFTLVRCSAVLKNSIGSAQSLTQRLVECFDLTTAAGAL